MTLNNQVVEFQNYQAMQASYGAQPLQVGNIEVYNSVSDLYDFVAIKRAVLGIGQPQGSYKEAADINRDGIIDLYDFVIKIRRSQFGS